jgi:hypothetical protein
MNEMTLWQWIIIGCVVLLILSCAFAIISFLYTLERRVKDPEGRK